MIHGAMSAQRSMPVKLSVRPITTRPAYDQLVDVIREQIASGELRPGDRLPTELSIAGEAGVSRSTVREALRTLEQAGLLHRLSRKTLVVSDPDVAAAPARGVMPIDPFEARSHRVKFRDIVEAALLVDPELARLATTRGTPDEFARLAANLEEQEGSIDDFERWLSLDATFHNLIAEIAGNAPLIMTRRMIGELHKPSQWELMKRGAALRSAYGFHQSIVERMVAGDDEGAAYMARKHVLACRDIWLEAGFDYNREFTAVFAGAGQ
jgi:DNA-binding FadR family transcriptional regulator